MHLCAKPNCTVYVRGCHTTNCDKHSDTNLTKTNFSEHTLSKNVCLHHITHCQIVTLCIWSEVVAVNEVPTFSTCDRGGGALPGKVVAHPIHADVLRSPAPSTLPHHRTAIQLGVQRGLKEDLF